jgi:hypothetical protein
MGMSRREITLRLIARKSQCSYFVLGFAGSNKKRPGALAPRAVVKSTPRSVYVLHAFQKKSKKGIATPKAEIDLIEKRLKDLIKEKEGRQ